MPEHQATGPPLRFANKVVVITGSGTGIGQAIARRFAEEGAHIVIMGRRKEPLDQTSIILNEIISSTGSGASVTAFAGVDVADEEGITRMFKSISDKFGKVDIVVNNAGVSGPVRAFTNASVKDFRDCVSIHLTGTFWTTSCALKTMQPDGTVITISTFFSEENRYEQRPYRFRTPYTASQGAKNRLAEAFAWELAERKIRSIATNPGPVHSDRIYKTVYPKAAAEFLRIGGYPGLSSLEVEAVTADALPLLGESEEIVTNGVRAVATNISKIRGESSQEKVSELEATVLGALNKIQEIAEKIQNNTSKMIVDGEFLTQDDVAEMVANLSSQRISKLINGRVIPNDRVFYPVKPVVGTEVSGSSEDVTGKVVVITVTSSVAKDIERVKSLARSLGEAGAKQTIILYQNLADEKEYKDFHSHAIDLSREDSLNKIFRIASSKFGKVDAVVHFTGEFDYSRQFASMSRAEWDSLVANFIHIPALVTKEAVNSMAPEGSVFEPSRYKGTNGRIIIVGPDSPVGKKISGEIRARSEVFRGALRPYTATVNQELSDVLGSNIRLFLIFAGNNEGTQPDLAKLQTSIVRLIASDRKAHEAIFYIDEARQ